MNRTLLSIAAACGVILVMAIWHFSADTTPVAQVDRPGLDYRSVINTVESKPAAPAKPWQGAKVPSQIVRSAEPNEEKRNDAAESVEKDAHGASDVPWQERLKKAKWPDTAINAVSDLLLATHGNTPVTFSRHELQQLESLGGELTPKGFHVVSEAPELLPWLCSVSRPDYFCDAFFNGDAEQKRTFRNILLLQADFRRGDDLSKLWHECGERITRAWTLGIPGTEAILDTTSLSEYESPYARWVVNDLLADHEFSIPEDGTDKLISRIVFAITQGAYLRYKLSANDSESRSFAIKFETMWGHLNAASERTRKPIEYLAEDSRVWKLLLRDDAPELLAKIGPGATEMLYGSQAFPPELHHRVLGLLESRRTVAVQMLQSNTWRSSPHLHRLMRKDISNETLLRAFDDVFSAQTRANEQLAELAELSSSQLEVKYKMPVDLDQWDDVLPAFLKVPKRKLSGESLDEGDQAQLGIEITQAVLLLVGVYVPPGGASIAIEASDHALEQASDGLGQSLEVRKQQFIASTKRIREVLPREEFDALMNNARRPIVLGDTIRLSQHLGRGSLANRNRAAVTVLEFLYKQSPLWASSLQNLSENKENVVIDNQHRIWRVQNPRDDASTKDHDDDSEEQWRSHLYARWRSLTRK